MTIRRTCVLVAAGTLPVLFILLCWFNLPVRVRAHVLAGEFFKAARAVREWRRMSASLVCSGSRLESCRMGGREVLPCGGTDYSETAIRELNAWEGRLDTRLRVPAELPVGAFYELLRRSLRKPGDTVTLEALPTPGSSEVGVKSVTVRWGENCNISFNGFGPGRCGNLIVSRADCCPASAPTSHVGSGHGFFGPLVTRDETGEFFLDFPSGAMPLRELAKNNDLAHFAWEGFAVFEVSETMPAEEFVDFLRAVEALPQIRHCGILRGEENSISWVRPRGKELMGPILKRNPNRSVR